MAMTPGIVTVAPDGAVTKSGFAEIVYDLLVDGAEDDGAALTGATGVAIKKGLARLANLHAAGILYMQVNGTAGGDPIE